ncbi:hypothetical protein Sjap_013184 [Stephania japonica]|uniref:Uncharacterized protein n=1 Tax=Stephania japonica TaxID=461633 RepID=A0AAP0IXA2_9MAGN
MQAKMNLRKFNEAIVIIDKLIELEPSNIEWPLFKSHIQIYNGDIELARYGFEGVLSRDPFSVEAYHGLIMVGAQSGSAELDAIIKRIESKIDKCKKERMKDVARDLILLIAQIRVIEGKYTDALKVYQDLVKEEPKDFRPYLCQGIIYTLLRKKDEADKQFQKYKRLVPKGHPYTGYFDDNMIATQLFAQKVENEKMGRS